MVVVVVVGVTVTSAVVQSVAMAVWAVLSGTVPLQTSLRIPLSTPSLEVAFFVPFSGSGQRFLVELLPPSERGIKWSIVYFASATKLTSTATKSRRRL